jgi:hypothetical protein
MKKIRIGLQVVLYSFATILGTLCFVAIIFMAVCFFTVFTQGVIILTLGEKLFLLAGGVFLFWASLFLMTQGDVLLKKAKKAFNSE